MRPSLWLLALLFEAAEGMRRGSLLMRSVVKEGVESPFAMARSLPLRMPTIILVNTYEEKNVGSVSRAMLNYGCHDLRLVSPECNHLGDEARRLAVGSVELLENAKTFATLADAVSDLQVVLATTARSRSATFQTYQPTQAAEVLVTESSYETTTMTKSLLMSGVVFGPEKNGLSNADLSLSTGVINIPSFDAYPVLNLAQSVNTVCYEIYQRKLELDSRLSVSSTAGTREREESEVDKDPVAAQKDLDHFILRLQQGLAARGFTGVKSKNNGNGKSGGELGETQFTSLLRIAKRSGLTTKELLMLNGMLTALLRA